MTLGSSPCHCVTSGNQVSCHSNELGLIIAVRYGIRCEGTIEVIDDEQCLIGHTLDSLILCWLSGDVSYPVKRRCNIGYRRL